MYRDMRKGRILPGVGNSLTQTLQYLAKVTADMRSEDFLKRLEAVEQRQAIRTQ